MTQLSRRSSRARSILSDDEHSTTRPTTLPSRRGGTRGVRATSVTSEAVPTTTPQTTRIPAHYFLAPTVPNPFSGTLEASLDATLHWSRTHPAANAIANTLLEPVSTSTNWPAILSASFGSTSTLDSKLGRFLLEDFLFLVTRTLLPEQIAENRAAMARLYDKKKQLAIRLVLRYDMLREWCVGDGPVGRKDVSVASLPPTTIAATSKEVSGDFMASGSAGEEGFVRRPMMPNIWATLIAAPEGGFTTHGVRERMKHYITPLDAYLLLSDEEIKSWSDQKLVVRASQIVLQWQWLRQKNEALDEMQCGGWEELEGKADECEWIAERREVTAGKGGKAGAEEGF
ncbi:hypothetical protein ST47_g366 [Ascochyta rabiei]|uniref:Uncharacterized protein n=1 Tax=Didymella rabiei TaxID=5454 RepID=A0A163M8U6_DIDRA|nr:hypothetical protein ST47_g366 [Ascochyta rabiei]